MIDKNRLYSEIGRIIQAERAKKGLTQEELGSAIGLSRPSVTNLEKGRQGILIHTLFEIADKLGVAVGNLLPDVQIEPAGEREALNVLLKKSAVTKKEAAFIKKAFQS